MNIKNEISNPFSGFPILSTLRLDYLTGILKLVLAKPRRPVDNCDIEGKRTRNYSSTSISPKPHLFNNTVNNRYFTSTDS